MILVEITRDFAVAICADRWTTGPVIGLDARPVHPVHAHVVGHSGTATRISLNTLTSPS